MPADRNDLWYEPVFGCHAYPNHPSRTAFIPPALIAEWPLAPSLHILRTLCETQASRPARPGEESRLRIAPTTDRRLQR